jgi:hypothetical protein
MIYHTGLTIEKWGSFPFLTRLANIGSEVYRAISWREKQRSDYAELAFNRSLELFDATKSTTLNAAQLKEICRLRELWADYFAGDNKFASDKKFFNDYFNFITVRSKAVL